MTLTFKPCPFCGSKKITIDYPIADAYGYLAFCTECGCEYHTEHNNRGKAIADWNKRADLHSKDSEANC